jgi:hypothetical protein
MGAIVARKFTLVILFILIEFSGTHSYAANREVLFSTALNRLGFYLRELENTGDLHLTQPEHEMLTPLVELTENWTYSKAIGYMIRLPRDQRPEYSLEFDSNPYNFIINDGEAPRTAKTTSDINSRIYINQNIINSPDSNISYLDAIQLLIHELGHKIANKNQAAVDSLAAKIKEALRQYYLIQELPDGRILELISLSRTKPDNGTFRNTSFPDINIVPMAEKEIAMFITSNQIVEDQSSIFLESIYKTRHLINLENQFVPEIVDTKLQILNTTIFPLPNQYGSLIQLELKKESKVIRPTHGYPNQFQVNSPPEETYAPISNRSQFWVQIRIPNGKNPILEIRQTRTQNLEQVIKLVDSNMKDISSLILTCQVPEELLTKELTEKPVSLLVNFDDGEYLVIGKREKQNSDLWSFRLEIPRKSSAQHIYFDRIVIDNSTEVFLDRGRKISLNLNNTLKPIKIEPNHDVQIQSQNQAKVSFTVKSYSTIKQIRITRYKTLSGHLEPNQMEKQKELQWLSGGITYSRQLGDLKNFHLVREELILTKGQFRQSRISQEEWLIEADLPDPATQTEYGVIPTNLTRVIGRNLRISNQVYYPTRVDNGQRSIEEIEVINSQLQSIKTQISLPYTAPFRVKIPKCSEFFDEPVVKPGYADPYI